MRFLRAGLAAWAFWEAYQTHEWLLLLPGGIFAVQAVFNVGCCGASGCATPTRYSAEQAGQETVVYEEIR